MLIHYQSAEGALTSCGIVPGSHGLTRVVRDWPGVTCQSCYSKHYNRSRLSFARAVPREAVWGDLYFWRRDRPNKSWHWKQGREFPLAKLQAGLLAVMDHPPWRSCPTQFKYYGTRTGRWRPDARGNETWYPNYWQPRLHIPGNRADSFIIDDPIAPQTATQVNEAMGKAWRSVAERPQDKPDMIHCDESFLKAYKANIEARINAAYSDALLYGSGSYSMAADDLKTFTPQVPTEIQMSSINTQSFAKNVGSEPAGHVPARPGQPWTPELDSRLIRFLKGGFSVAEIAVEWQRSEVAIQCRIVFLAYKDERAAVLVAGIAKLTAEPKAPRKPAKRKAKKSRK